jgi:hypothetical protein
MLIRTTLIAFNQANQTGNYSVLRDLGTPKFQAMNTDAHLGEAFTPFRVRNLDLSPILFFDPKLVREPAIEAGRMLRLTGFIPTSPERILFDLGFELEGSQWRLSAIAVDLQRAPAPQAQSQDNKSADQKAAPQPGAAPTKAVEPRSKKTKNKSAVAAPPAPAP